jgi:hypothetical protein
MILHLKILCNLAIKPVQKQVMAFTNGKMWRILNLYKKKRGVYKLNC